MAKKPSKARDKELDAIALTVLPHLIAKLPQADGAEGMQVLVSAGGDFDAAQNLARQAYLLAHAMRHVGTLELKDITG